jgi:TonB family protein
MRASVVIVSVIAHGAVLGPLLYWAPRHDSAVTPELHEITVVPPAPKPAPPPPPAPAARTETIAPTRVRKPAAPRAPRVSTPAPATGSGDATPSSGSGSGSGSTGDGSGSASSDVDRSGPPVPVDPSAARTLPYTAEATRDRVSGDVVVSLEIDADGRVTRALVKRGLGHGLDEIATKIAMQLQFRPATDRSGAPVAGRVRWRFHFQPP